jgi:hypothetical protein
MENTIIKNSVILDLDVYTQMQKELQLLRDTKGFLFYMTREYIGSTWSSSEGYYSSPTLQIEGSEEMKKLIQDFWDTFDNSLIEDSKRKAKEIDKLNQEIVMIKGDDYINKLRSENYELNCKVKKLEKLEQLNSKLEDEIKYLKSKK